MAKIILNVELNSSQALSGIQKINSELSNLGSKQNTGSGFSGTKKSLNNLKKSYNDLLTLVKNTESRYPQGIFTNLIKSIEHNVKAVNSLKSYNKEAKALSQALSDQSTKFSQAKAAADKYSEISIAKMSKQFIDLKANIKKTAENYPTGTFSTLQGQVTKAINVLKNLDVGTDDYAKTLQKLDIQLARNKETFSDIKLNTEKVKKVMDEPIKQESFLSEKQLNNLKKNYNDFLRQISSEETKYPKGTFTNLKKEVEANVNAINGLTTSTEGYSDKAKGLDTQLSAQKANFAQLRQETKQNTDAVVKHGDSVASLAKKFVLWQAAATLVMQPINMVRNAVSSLNETLVETETRLVELNRVLPEGSATAREEADALYGLAEKYGQTFDNVSQIAVNFARTGLGWQDTLKATESAVLALNVAELDTEEATNGLIAIMSQFNLQASDLTLVVDKLNKTADNFPVTSEKLLKALQRTGSSAQNANLSLDETIGLVTSLSKATGRSGENIGTAVNSLIQYSSKAESLDIFAQLNEDTAKKVDDYRHGLATILDVWQSVSDVIQNMNSEQEELLKGLTESEDITNLNSELHDELGDIFEQVSDVYGTANTFRKNYFIALLGNMQTVLDAQNVASDAEGYSQKENLQYLDTYEAKANTLKSTWEEFVNDEQGFLGFKKGLVDAGTTLLNILDSVGGLKTALLSIGVILLNITKEQTIGKIVQFFAGKGFIDKFKNFITSFPNKLKNIPSKLKNISKSFSEYDELMEIARARTLALTNAEEELSTAKIALVKAQETGIGITEAEEAVKSAETKVEIANTEATEANNAAKAASATVISTITAGITALIVVYQIYNAIQRNHVESLRKEAEQAQNEYEQINELRTNLKDLASDLKDNNITQEEAQKKYIENAAALKKLGINADEVAGTYTNLTDKLAALNKELANKEWEKAKNVETTAAAKLENKASEFLIPNAMGPSISYSFILGDNAEQMLDKYDKLVEKKEKLLEQNKEESSEYKYISKTIGEMSEEMEAYRNALTEKASAYVVSNVDIKNADEYNKLVKEITDGKGEWAKSTETYRNILVSEIMLAYPKYASQVSQVEKDTKNTATDLSEVKNKYEDISNALKKILDDEQDAKQLASYNEKIKEAQLDVEKAREKVADAIKEKEQAQKDLAKKQLELKKAIAKAQADYINNAIDKYIDKLDVSNDKEEKLKAIEEAKTDLAEKRLEVEEKRLELAKEEEKLAKLKEQRTIKQFSQASQSFEFVADEKKVKDQIDAVDKAREAVNSAEKAVVGAEEKIADAQNSLNDWLKNQAIAEIKKYIENGGTSEKKINSILDKWLGQSGNGKLSSEMKSWKNGVTKTIDTASKKATTQNKEIKKSIESAKNAVKSAKEALKKKEQGIIDANKDVKSAIKKVDETKVDKQTYLKTQAINAVTALLSDGKSHTSKEVKALIGSYGLSSNIEGKIWNTIVKAGGFNPDLKGTRRHWKTYDDATKDGITGLFTLNEFNLRKKSNSKATKDYADYQAYLDAMYAKYKGGSNLYDKGGILHGLGGIKATNQPETVLDPTLTKKILEPSSNSNFTNFAKSLGILFGASDNLARTSYTTNNGATNNNDNRNYTINGVPFTQQQVNTHTLGELLETAAFLRE